MFNCVNYELTTFSIFSKRTLSSESDDSYFTGSSTSSLSWTDDSFLSWIWSSLSSSSLSYFLAFFSFLSFLAFLSFLSFLIFFDFLSVFVVIGGWLDSIFCYGATSNPSSLSLRSNFIVFAYFWALARRVARSSSLDSESDIFFTIILRTVYIKFEN